MNEFANMQVERWEIGQVKPYERNARKHPTHQVEALAASITEYGWTVPLLVAADGELIAGHGRHLAALMLKITHVPVIVADHLTAEQRQAYRLADNRLAEMSVWDDPRLKAELQELSAKAHNLKWIGFDAKEIIARVSPPPGQKDDGLQGVVTLAESYIEPPFSILNSRSGRWQARKRQWIEALPIDYTQLGRDLDLQERRPRTSEPRFFGQKQRVEARLGREISSREFEDHYYEPAIQRQVVGTSMFDPVLAEVVTIWFSPLGGVIYDPFGGDAERGLVAASKGRKYYGMELRKEQVSANKAAAKRLGVRPVPRWIRGDAAHALNSKMLAKVQADLIFSCPPYWNVEQYSDDPADLSNMGLHEFEQVHSDIIGVSLALLRDDRFAVWVIGDAMDDDGHWAHLPDMTTRAFEHHGAHLHNSIILDTPIGSRRMVARRYFESKRRAVRRHEHVLVFCKGDPEKATAALGPVAIGEIPDK